MSNLNPKQLKIAKRYAAALLGFENRDALFSELLQVKETFSKSSDLIEFLENPIVSTFDKKDVVSKVFENASQEVLNFLYVLIDKNRIYYFGSIMEEFSLGLDEVNNVKRLEIVSAVSLTEEEKDSLRNKLQKKLSCEISPNYIIDESILAGLIIKIGDKVIDNSLKSRFENMKRQIL